MNDPALLQAFEEGEQVVGRVVADTSGCGRADPGQGCFLERQVGMQVGLGGPGPGVAFSGVRSCVSWP